MIKYAVHIENICFAYESEMVLKHLSMDIAPNSICFIMGNNGSGKTTLLKNMMGFLAPKQGVIKIAEKSVADIDKQALSHLVSYVPQAIHLNTDFSVIDYISLGRTPHLGVFSKLTDDDYRIIENISVLLGVDTIYEIPFNKLSGGQKQMVAIARSLVQDTPLIIMDEPMSALDIGKQVELLNVLRGLTENGKTIILTTHNPNHALVLESNSCFLKQGEIVAFGRSSDIIQDELLHTIYGNNISLDYGEKGSSIVFEMNSDKELIV